MKEYELKTPADVEELFKDLEDGKVTKEEFYMIVWLSHSMAHSKGFETGFNSADARCKRKHSIDQMNIVAESYSSVNSEMPFPVTILGKNISVDFKDGRYIIDNNNKE
jgi:hypothetical protein